MCVPCCRLYAKSKWVLVWTEQSTISDPYSIFESLRFFVLLPKHFHTMTDNAILTRTVCLVFFPRTCPAGWSKLHWTCKLHMIYICDYDDEPLALRNMMTNSIEARNCRRNQFSKIKCWRSKTKSNFLEDWTQPPKTEWRSKGFWLLDSSASMRSLFCIHRCRNGIGSS